MSESITRPSLSSEEFRVLMLVHAAEEALVAPLRATSLHLMAYLVNVLAPVWDVPLLDGKLLKRGAGPFYPGLQAAADRLVGQGLLILTELDYALDEDKQWRLIGAYVLNHTFADPILRTLERFPEERKVRSFCLEVAYSLSALEPSDIEGLSEEDATYGDPIIDLGNVVDFGEWKHENFSANAAETLGSMLHSRDLTTAGEKLHSYVRHLGRRLHASR